MLEQQDTSEAFAFITETLQLPLLSLQVDLFHQGKRDKDDHKVVYERLLNLAVPPDPEEKGIKLEDCLEEYFNAQVDVQRDSEEAKKASWHEMSRSDLPRLVHRDTIRLITEELGESSTPTVTASPIAMSPSQRTPTNEKVLQFSIPESKPEEPKSTESKLEASKPEEESKPEVSKPEESKPKEETKPEELKSEESKPAESKSTELKPEESKPDENGTPSETPDEGTHAKAVGSEPGLVAPQPKPTVRARSTSVIQRVLLDEQGRPSSPDNPTMLQKAMRKGSTVVKAVTIPAWQFFRLIRKSSQHHQ